MNILTKKDLEIIESNGLLEYLRQVQHGYKRASTHSQDVIAHRLVEQVTGSKYSMNWGCAKCIYDLYKTLSTYYFKAIEKNNNQEKTNKEDGHNSEPQKEPKRKGKKKRSP